MFQSFPLGDKSSVNLRGEYHTENVTIFDQPIAETEQHQPALMAVDDNIEGVGPKQDGLERAADANEELGKEISNASKSKASATSIKAEDQPVKAENAEEDSNRFYSMFWSLQKNFAMPTRLFEDENFKQFKQSMGLTMQKFQTVNQGLQARNPPNSADESRRSMKRKRASNYEDDLSDSFNPKYLTSQDLFDLEVGRIQARDCQVLMFLDQRSSLSPAYSGASFNLNRFPSFPYTQSEEEACGKTQQVCSVFLYPCR